MKEREREAVFAVVSKAVESTSHYPFLFIGSGLSRRYMGAPSWEELLKGICENVLEDPFAYAKFLGEAKMAKDRGEVRSIMPRVATLMEPPVHEALFGKEKFAHFVKSNLDRLSSGTSALKIYAADIFKRLSMGRMTDETELLSRVGRERLSGVITTNYDQLCESLFPGFVTYVGEGDLLFSDPTFAQETYKIHGSTSDPESMILTEADYRRFEEREKYLAAKLLTIFAEYPIVFMGYSLQDENINELLSSIVRCAGERGFKPLGDRLIFVTRGSAGAPAVSSRYVSLGKSSLETTTISTDEFSVVYEAILNTQRTYDMRLVRELRGNIFNIVRKLDAKSRTVVASIDKALETLGDDDRVVIGFGTETPERGAPVKLVELYEDIVFDDSPFSPALVFHSYLEDLLRNNSHSVPIFKYLQGSGVDISEYDAVGQSVSQYAKSHTSIEHFLSDAQKRAKAKYRDAFPEALSLEAIIRKEGEGKAFQFVKYLDEEEIDIEKLGAYLKKMLTGADGEKDLRLLERDTYKSEFRKCVRIYDFMRYGKGKPPGLHQAPGSDT